MYFRSRLYRLSRVSGENTYYIPHVCMDLGKGISGVAAPIGGTATGKKIPSIYYSSVL